MKITSSAVMKPKMAVPSARAQPSSRGGGGDNGLVLIQQHGLAGFDLHLVGAAVQSHFVFHDYLTSLMEMKRSSFRGLPILSATMAISIAAVFGSTS